LTHTHHRRGEKTSLKEDYVILAMTARGYNADTTAPKLQQVLEICARHNPVNMGNMSSGKSLCMARGASSEEIINKTGSKGIVHAVYADKESVQRALNDLKVADLGISIVTSGIFDEVFEIADDVGITQPRTVNISLGILGNTKQLPPEAILELITMCGHSLVSKNLIEDQIEKVKSQKKTAQKAADELARQCVCGIFNPARAAKLIEKYVEI